MRCPSCLHNSTRVLDSRPVDDYRSIRRRRECEQCNYRFTTFEKIEDHPLVVIKKDGTKEEFSKEKILRGLIRACEKRPVEIEELETIANNVEHGIRSIGITEIKSEMVGDMLMNDLSKLDDVAYVRFASVYKSFDSLDMFIDELQHLRKENKDK